MPTLRARWTVAFALVAAVLYVFPLGGYSSASEQRELSKAALGSLPLLSSAAYHVLVECCRLGVPSIFAMLAALVMVLLASRCGAANSPVLYMFLSFPAVWEYGHSVWLWTPLALLALSGAFVDGNLGWRSIVAICCCTIFILEHRLAGLGLVIACIAFSVRADKRLWLPAGAILSYLILSSPKVLDPAFETLPVIRHAISPLTACLLFSYVLVPVSSRFEIYALTAVIWCALCPGFTSGEVTTLSLVLLFTRCLAVTRARARVVTRGHYVLAVLLFMCFDLDVGSISAHPFSAIVKLGGGILFLGTLLRNSKLLFFGALSCFVVADVGSALVLADSRQNETSLLQAFPDLELKDAAAYGMSNRAARTSVALNTQWLSPSRAYKQDGSGYLLSPLGPALVRLGSANDPDVGIASRLSHDANRVSTYGRFSNGTEMLGNIIGRYSIELIVNSPSAATAYVFIDGCERHTFGRAAVSRGMAAVHVETPVDLWLCDYQLSVGMNGTPIDSKGKRLGLAEATHVDPDYLGRIWLGYTRNDD